MLVIAEIKIKNKSRNWNIREKRW